MRYQIQLATSVDVAFLAAVIDDDREQWSSQGEGDGVPIDRLLQTTSPTTCPHGRPVILRLSMKDIERGFQRS